MDITAIINAITTVGFPIVACICLAVYIKQRDAHLIEIIKENTQVMTETKDELHHLAEKVGDFTEIEKARNPD